MVSNRHRRFGPAHAGGRDFTNRFIGDHRRPGPGLALADARLPARTRLAHRRPLLRPQERELLAGKPVAWRLSTLARLEGRGLERRDRRHDGLSASHLPPSLRLLARGW